MAACGGDFTVAVTEDGELLAWGAGRDGHLGLGDVLHQQQPARAGGLFGNQRIRLAAAGECHLAVVAEDGAVYTCGYGVYGQLGLGDGQPRRRLTRVPQALFAGSRVVMVSCGGSMCPWKVLCPVRKPSLHLASRRRRTRTASSRTRASSTTSSRARQS